MILTTIFLCVTLATEITTLIEDFEDFRKNLVNDFFDLELDIRDVFGEDAGTNISHEATNIRKKFVEISDRLMDMELEINKRFEVSACGNWYLGMNLNPSDGHIMDYLTGWASGVSIGTNNESLSKDYLNELVWKEPADMIAIVRHQKGVADAVKVFEFTEPGLSMLHRFQLMNPGRIFASKGGSVHLMIAADAENLSDDPIFSIGGDLVLNWAYGKNGARIALSGGYLSGAAADDDNTHGLGNHFHCNPLTGVSLNEIWRHEISNIQDCPASTCRSLKVQGTDHGTGSKYVSGPVYGNYAIYVSRDADTFPSPGAELDLIVKSC